MPINYSSEQKYFTYKFKEKSVNFMHCKEWQYFTRQKISLRKDLHT